MKLILLSLLVSVIAHADPHDNECTSIPQLFHYQIVRKLDDHHYLMLSAIGKGPFQSPAALLTTHKTKFDHKGELSWTMYQSPFRMKHTGRKTVRTDDGFDTVLELWEECKQGEQ